MNIQLLQVPYDSGHEDLRTGGGPAYFIRGGIEQVLKDSGHQVDLERITSNSAWKADIETTFELDRLLAEQVERAMAKGRFPLVLAGACHSCVGTLAGIGPDAPGLVWFDAHGDFNTPETTTSGLLDGMGLAMATGRCWRALLKTVPNFHPIPATNVIHIGGYDFDPEEYKELQSSEINLIESGSDLDQMRRQLGAALTRLSKNVNKVYIHMDLDVLDTGSALANHAASAGGLPMEFVTASIASIKEQFEVCAGAVASVDPAYDRERQVLAAGIEIIQAIVE